MVVIVSSVNESKVQAGAAARFKVLLEHEPQRIPLHWLIHHAAIYKAFQPDANPLCLAVRNLNLYSHISVVMQLLKLWRCFPCGKISDPVIGHRCRDCHEITNTENKKEDMAINRPYT